MININSIAKGLSEASLLRKTQKKESKASKTRFSKAAKATANIDHGNGLNVISAINPFLFLQEIDEYQNDQERLKESGNRILKALNEIRLALIDGELNDHMIRNLINSLTLNTLESKFPELQNVINDIVLRCEIEIAKIEKNRKI